MERLEGKRIAVLVEKLYEDLELWYPVLRLREAGCDVKIVGPRAGETYASKHGYPAKADASAAEVKADDFDAIIIPGGYSPDHMRRHQAMVDLGLEITGAARVAGDHHGLAARAQFGGQAQRREHVPAGPAGCDHHGPAHSGNSALGRRRVSARNSPMPKARAHSEEPP